MLGHDHSPINSVGYYDLFECLSCVLTLIICNTKNSDSITKYSHATYQKDIIKAIDKDNGLVLCQ